MVAALILLLTVLAIAIPSWFIVKGAMAAKPLVDAAKARFFQRVGYSYGGPQSALAEDEGQRALAEGQLAFHCEKRREASALVTTQSWLLTLRTPSYVSFRLVSRHLVGAARLVENVFSRRAIKVARQYPGPHPVGEPMLDARYVLFTDDPAAARAVLLRPEVVRALAPFTSVVLDVGPDGLLFEDPADGNLWAAYEAAGHSRMSANPAPMIDVAADVHLAVHRLLATLASPPGAPSFAPPPFAPQPAYAS